MTWWLKLFLDLLCAVGWLRTLVLVAGRPASRWRTGWAGKAITLVVSALLVATLFGVWVPWGAGLVWWRVIVRGRDPFELPMADGRPMP